MNKITLAMLATALIVCGCGKANIEITNKTGHDEVYTILTYEDGQAANYLKANGTMIKKNISSGSCIVSASAMEFDDEANVTWDYSYSKTFDICAGTFSDNDYKVDLNSSGITVRED